MNALGFALECAALVGLFGALATVVVRAGLRMVERLAPAARATALLSLGVLPSAMAALLVLGAALPSLGRLVGVGADHCVLHDHHAHLCLEHFAGLRPPLALVGSLAACAFIARAMVMSARRLRAAKTLAALERGAAAPKDGPFPIVVVPGAPRLLHAAGVLRRRVLVSAGFFAALPPSSIRAALAHEEAHLTRRDGAALLLLDAAALLIGPTTAAHVRRAFLQAADEAADDDAAARLGDRVAIAQALVDAARFAVSTEIDHVAPGMTGTSIERRVARLLVDDRAVARSRGPTALLVVAATALAACAAVVALSSAIHHEVETLLHHLS